MNFNAPLFILYRVHTYVYLYINFQPPNVSLECNTISGSYENNTPKHALH